MQELKFSPTAKKFLKDAQSGWKLRLYFLKNLPTAWWWGLRLKHADEHSCSVTIPYNWRTKNPFRSIYFAALSMAAEMSTGVLGQLACDSVEESIAMLVVKCEGEFYKKAVSRTTFTCHQGQEFFAAVQETVKTGKPVTVTATSLGTMANGTLTSKFSFTWSFKRR